MADISTQRDNSKQIIYKTFGDYLSDGAINSMLWLIDYNYNNIPDLTGLIENSVPYIVDGNLSSSDAMVDPITKGWTFAHTIEVPGGSIDIGEVTSLSSATGHLLVKDEILDVVTGLIDYSFDSTGSTVPNYLAFGAEHALDIQLDFSEILTDNPLIWSGTSTVLDPDTRQIVSSTFKTGSVMTNVRAKITDTATGLALRYIPSKYVWDTGVGGLTTVVGDNTFNFLSDADDTPGVFNLGIQPWLTREAQDFSFEVRADSIDMLGDSLGQPYQTAIIQDGPHVNLALEDKGDRNQLTGLLEGGLVTLASSTTLDWTSGRGQVADYSDPENPIINDEVTWEAVSGLTPTYLATDGTSVFGYNNNGVLQQKLLNSISIEDAHNIIWFGSVTHVSSTIINIIEAPGNLGYDGIGSFSDFINLVIGPANVDGNVYDANGANLNIDIMGGNAFMIGSNFRNDPKISDIVTLPSYAPHTFQKVYRSVDPGLNVSYEGIPTTTIDPSKYDDGSGTLVSTTAGYWTIQRIFRTRDDITFVAYGQEEFINRAQALDALEKEAFIEKSPLPFTLFRCSLLIQEGATELNDLDQAEFFEQSSFRVGGAQSSAATIPGITNPGGIDTSIQFNDSNVFGGDSNFLYDSTLKTIALQASVAGSATYEFVNSSDEVKGIIRYSETADEFSISATGTTSEIHLNDVAYVHRGVLDGRIDIHAVTAAGSALLTLSTAGGGTVLSLEADDATDSANITAEIGDLLIATDEADSDINISPDGGLGIRHWPTANYALDVYAVKSEIVGLYSTKGVTLEVGTYGDSESTNFIFNKDDVGIDQSEFVLFNNNHSTESTRYFRMGYADEIATQGGLNISDANNFVSIGTRTDPDSPLHVYQNDTETGDQCGITIEQDGTGDAVLQYLLSGGQRWVTGISNAGGDAFEIASSINLGSNTRFLINTTGEVKIPTSLMVGSESNPASPLHIYQNDILTGADSGITIEQDSTGDAVLHYVLTGIQTVSTGVDYSGSGHYKISGSADLSTDPILIATIAGNVSVGGINPVSTLHVYDDTTTVGSSIGLTIEQDGTGDALAQWHLSGGVRYLAGIDNSDLDQFKIEYGGFLSTDAAIQITIDNEVGVGISPDSKLHIYQSDNETGDQAGLTIEQGGTGDAIAQFLLTSGQRWVMGLSNAGGDAFEIASSINLGSDTRFVINTTGEVKITDSLSVGTVSDPASKLHVYQDDAVTGTSGGITIEQDGGGDAMLQFLLTGGTRWVMGIDNDDNDRFKINLGNSMATNDNFILAETNGIDLHISNSSTVNWELAAGIEMHNHNSADDTYTSLVNRGVSNIAAGILFKNDDYSADYAHIVLGARDANGLEDHALIVKPAHTEIVNSTNTPYGGRGQIQNRLTYSQDLDNADWVLGGGNPPVVTPNNAIAPDGTMTADTVSIPGPAGGKIGQINIGIIDDDIYNVSGWLRLVSGGTPIDVRLSGGTQESWVATDRWQRFSSDLVGGVSDIFDLIMLTADTPAVLEIWGIQISDGAGEKPYLKTKETALLTQTQGITVNGDIAMQGAGSSTIFADDLLTIDVEHTEITNSTNTPFGGRGQVQNLLKYSQEFDNAIWLKASTNPPVVTANNAMAPDGTMTADTLSFGGPGAGLIRQGTLGLIEDDTYNVSGWVRWVSGGTQLTARLDTDNVDAWIATSEWQRFDSDIVQGAGGPWFDLFVFEAHAPAVFEVWGLQISDGAGSKPYLKTAETPLLTATTGATVNNSLYIKDAREVATTGPEVVEVWSLDDMPRVGGTGDVIPEYKLYRFMQEIDWGTTRLKLENDAYALFEGTDVFVTSQTYSGTDPWIYGEGTIRCVGNGMTWKITSDNSTMFDITSGGWGMDYSTLMTTGDNCSLGTIVAPSVTDPLLGARFISTRSLFQGFKTGLTLVDPGNIHIDISFFYDSSDAVGPMLSVIGMGKAGVIEATEVTMASATSDFLYISPITEAPVTCLGVTLADGQSFFTTGDTGAITLFSDATITAQGIDNVTSDGGIADFEFTGSTVYVGQKVVITGYTTNPDYNGTFTITETDGTTYFKTGVDWGSDEGTGAFDSDSVTIVSATHGLSNGDAVLITNTMEYNHGSVIYAVQTNAFQVNTPWHTAETSGTWNDGSLDHSSKYVTSFNNGAQQDSNPAPSFNVADNATTTTTTTGWGAVAFGTTGSALITGNTNQNFALLDDVTGLIRYEGLDPLTIKFTPSISMLKAGGAVEHQFRMFKTTGTPTFDPHTIKRSISTVTGAASLNCSAFLNPGDEFRLEVKATTTGSTITITDFSL